MISVDATVPDDCYMAYIPFETQKSNLMLDFTILPMNQNNYYNRQTLSKIFQHGQNSRIKYMLLSVGHQESQYLECEDIIT
jgi:hypothetical protein